jgi:hypothetical protein
VSFAAITLSVISQRMFIIVVSFVIDLVRKLFDTPAYIFAFFLCCEVLCTQRPWDGPIPRPKKAT